MSEHEQANKYSGMSHDQWCLAAAYDAVTSRPVEEIAARKPVFGDWVFVDDYPAYNPNTGKPATYDGKTPRQIFTVHKVDSEGNVIEVYPDVLNWPHAPISVQVTAQSRIRCYDPRVAYVEVA